MPKLQHVHIRIIGKVQGVFFRASAKRLADGLGITGRIRNNPDSSVTIEAEGEEETLHEFLDWCHDGPQKAKVEQVDIEKGSPQYYNDFQIVD